MKNRVFPFHNRCCKVCAGLRLKTVRILFSMAAAAVVFCLPPEKTVPCRAENAGGAAVQTGMLILEDPSDKTRYAGYEMSVGDVFSVGFVHSVNQSPVTDYFEIREDGIYGVKTVYYGFGAGVPTDLEEGLTLSYGDDGSMIISGYEMKMNNLIYRVGTVSDHILQLDEGDEISLRDLCGRNARVAFRFEPAG